MTESTLPLLEDLAAQLAPLLEARGLTIALDGAAITVLNPREIAADPLGRALNPGLRQRIAVAEHLGGLWFFWLWPGAERGGPCEPEPMVPVADVAEAARRIGNVLRIDEPNGAGR